MSDLGYVALRSMRPDDVPFITATWLRNFWRAHWTARAARDQRVRTDYPRLSGRLRHRYFAAHKAAVLELLARGWVRVAVLAEDPDIILGYIVASAAGRLAASDGQVTALHYVYVKEAWRSRGIGRLLAQSALGALGDEHVVRTHVTDGSKRIVEVGRWPYVPYEAFLEGDTHESDTAESTGPA